MFSRAGKTSLLQLMYERASGGFEGFHRAYYLSCSGINGTGWQQHFKNMTKLDWKADIVGGSAQYMMREGGRSIGRTLILIDESQRLFDTTKSGSEDFWDLIKELVANKEPDSGVTVVLAAMYNVQLEGPELPVVNLGSPVRIPPSAIVDLRQDRPPQEWSVFYEGGLIGLGSNDSHRG